MTGLVRDAAWCLGYLLRWLWRASRRALEALRAEGENLALVICAIVVWTLFLALVRG